MSLLTFARTFSTSMRHSRVDIGDRVSLWSVLAGSHSSDYVVNSCRISSPAVGGDGRRFQ